MGSSNFVLYKTEKFIFICFDNNCVIVDKMSLYFTISYPLWMTNAVHMKSVIKTPALDVF